MPKLSKEKYALIDKELRAWKLRLPKQKQTVRNLAKLTGYNKNFVAKRLRKMEAEAVHRFHQASVQKYLSDYQDKIIMLNEELLGIIIDENLKPAERATAVRAYALNEKELFDKMFEAGVFEKKLGELDVKHKTLAGESLRSFLNEYTTIEGEVVENKAKKELPADGETNKQQ